MAQVLQVLREVRPFSLLGHLPSREVREDGSHLEGDISVTPLGSLYQLGSRTALG